MINMLRKGIKFSIQRVHFPQSYFESRHYCKRFNSIGKFKSLTFQLRAIYFHTFAVDMSVDHSSETESTAIAPNCPRKSGLLRTVASSTRSLGKSYKRPRHEGVAPNGATCVYPKNIIS